MIDNKELSLFIKRALSEDLGDGDHTSLSTIPEQAVGKAMLLVKDDGIIAGIEVALQIFKQVDDQLHINLLKQDGDYVKKGETAFLVEGSVQSILAAERLVLNVMQRMSGIATKTFKLNEIISGTSAKLLDTRKTTPNMRFLEKEAVRIGGGVNHRFGLFDMILIKDNHVDFAGGIKAALSAAHNYLRGKSLNLKVEIEVRNNKELSEVIEVGGIDRILLDNYAPEDLKEAVRTINGRYETEASGGITEHNILHYATTGVNYISIGALTHSVKSMDLSLKSILN